MTTKAKKKNPYQMLLDRIREFISDVRYRHKVSMWHYEKKFIEEEEHDLEDLYERTAAAEQLGYEVHLEAKEGGLFVYYVKNPPFDEMPPEWED